MLLRNSRLLLTLCIRFDIFVFYLAVEWTPNPEGTCTPEIGYLAECDESTCNSCKDGWDLTDDKILCKHCKSGYLTIPGIENCVRQVQYDIAHYDCGLNLGKITEREPWCKVSATWEEVPISECVAFSKLAEENNLE